LTELARLLESCAGYIGHDSGISHLAAALGLPGIILWGQSREEIWRPLSPRMVLLREPEGLSRLSIERVWEQVVATLGQEHVSP
jgi:ADP-heptose:LPS heptosyltransferase